MSKDRKMPKISSKEASKAAYDMSGGQRPAEPGNSRAAKGRLMNGPKHSKGKSPK